MACIDRESVKIQELYLALVRKFVVQEWEAFHTYTKHTHT